MNYAAIWFQPITAQIICRGKKIEIGRDIILPNCVATYFEFYRGKNLNRSRHNSTKLCRGKISIFIATYYLCCDWLKLDREIIELDRGILSVLWLVEIISRPNWIMSRSMCRVLTQTANHSHQGRRARLQQHEQARVTPPRHFCVSGVDHFLPIPHWKKSHRYYFKVSTICDEYIRYWNNGMCLSNQVNGNTRVTDWAKKDPGTRVRVKTNT